MPYYPWYSFGPSSHFGIWSRYSWYDPFGYHYGYGYPYGYGGLGLFGYDPYGFGYGHHYWGAPYYVSVDDQYEDERDRTIGSLRLRASPEHARVYVDGALAGTVDDFNGFSNHLELEQGVHHIELRADGYEVYSTEVDVEAGKTLTERASLKQLD